jgi:DNA primase
MRNHRNEIVGFRTRLENGQKLAIRGSRSGLFIPSGISKSGIIWIVEGPTDVAAMLDMELSAIGRPSCRGSEKEIQRWVRGHRVVIVSDNDGAGIGGADSLARTLRGSVSSVEIILPPWGMKDAREVANHGGRKDDWLILIGDSNDRRNSNGRQA